MLSSINLDLGMQKSSLSLQKCLYSYTHLRTNHLLTSTSTTGLQLASLNT
jgi:hypothetical protein